MAEKVMPRINDGASKQSGATQSSAAN